MFTTKKKELFKTKVKRVAESVYPDNQFLFGGAKKSAETVSGNFALKYKTSGSEWVNQFSNFGVYKNPRSFADISNDCATLWAQDQELFIKFALYTRMISRKTDLALLGIRTEKAQSGAELKHEGIMRAIWLQTKAPETFWKNVGLFVAAGSCKDLITMLRYDLVHHGWEGRVLDWDKFKNLILTLLENKSTTNLVKKYLPQIRAKSNCTTVDSQANCMIAKWICSFTCEGNYKQYRMLKTSGTAHQWQQLISQKKFDRIDFGKIHGRALTLLAKSKFLRNQNLQDRYSEWIKSQKTVKTTGYVYELLCELDANGDSLFEETVNKQFAEAVAKVKGDDENHTSLIVVRDISSSMTSLANGTKFSSYNIAKALALYFSEFLTGTFANHYMNFSSSVELKAWKGSTPVEKWGNARESAYGSTNFQGVIDTFCHLKVTGTPEEDFPQGILCVSDGEFDPAQLGKTNVDTALSELTQAGFSRDYVDNFKIILWNIPNSFYGARSGVKFETFGDVKNIFYMSGYSGSNVKFALENKVETAEEVFLAAMDQELLSLVTI
jgi:hypothetical protein